MNNGKLHIGKLVENAFNQSSLSKAEFARRIGIVSQNLNREFENEDWRVIKLINAGVALGHDFSYLFKIDDSKQVEQPKILLQIEVKEDNMQEIAKLIVNKDLYQIGRK
jgi:transcriptional regulator with XRE-family HTH domain